MVAGGAGLIGAALLFVLTLIALVSILQGAFAFSKNSPLRTASVLAGLEYLVLMVIIIRNSRYAPTLETLGSIVKFTAGAAVFFVVLCLFCIAFFLIGRRIRLLIFALCRLHSLES